MKKVLLVVMALFVLSINKVQASDFYKYSDDSKINAALEVLQNIGSNDVFSRLDKSETKIIFYDLSLMSYSYAKDYAISSTDESGNNYILINEKFKSAPKEAIACLIAHESIHTLAHPTLDEEVRATTTEAITWIKVRNQAAMSDSNNALVTRENKLANLYKSSAPGENLIKNLIANNSFYQQQLAMN